VKTAVLLVLVVSCAEPTNGPWADAGRDGEVGLTGEGTDASASPGEDAGGTGSPDAGRDGGQGAGAGDAGTPADAARSGDGATTIEGGVGAAETGAGADGGYSLATATAACGAYAQGHDAAVGACVSRTCEGVGDTVCFAVPACTGGEPCWGYDQALEGKRTICDPCSTVEGVW
jgi:hypothetical protein